MEADLCSTLARSPVPASSIPAATLCLQVSELQKRIVIREEQRTEDEIGIAIWGNRIGIPPLHTGLMLQLLH